MSQDLPFNLHHRLTPGVVEQVAPNVRRFTADNPGPHTFTGTNSYIIGEGRVAVIDPGPEDDAHLATLIEALQDETVTHIVVTHTHRDHSPLTRPLSAHTGAPVVGFAGDVRPADHQGQGIEAGGDQDFAPDFTLAHGHALEGPGWRLEALHTPGHAANHLCFCLAGTGVLFSGDHVMGWSTTMVAPPDGDMAAYLASLALLRARDDAVYLPGHGGKIETPSDYVRALSRHREAREASIHAALGKVPVSASDIALRIYEGLEPWLHRSAALTTQAHLIHLAGKGKAEMSAPAGVDTKFWLARN